MSNKRNEAKEMRAWWEMIARDFHEKQETRLLRCIPFLLHFKVLSNTYYYSLSNQTEKNTRRNQVISTCSSNS